MRTLCFPVPVNPDDLTSFSILAIMAGLFLRRDLVQELAGFDEGLGTGSAGWAQSGEESDVVLRALAGGARHAHRDRWQ